MTPTPDARLRAAYAAQAANVPGTPHPTPEQLAAAVEHSDRETERLTTLDHVASCASCRREFELLWATHAAARQAAVTTGWRLPAWSLAAAAVIVVAVSLSVARLRATHPTELAPDRGVPPAGLQHAITLIAPLGAAPSTAPRFVWRAVPTPGMYHLEVLDDSGAVAVSIDTRDTTFTPPGLTPGRAYRWWVQTRINGEPWQSKFAEFRASPSGS